MATKTISPAREAVGANNAPAGRAVPEWIATHPDQAIPTRVKLRIWNRCEGRCGLTGKKLMPGDAYDFDHITALVNGGEHRETNLHVVCRIAHREKTKADVAIKAKVARVRAKHLGLHKPKSGRKIASHVNPWGYRP